MPPHPSAAHRLQCRRTVRSDGTDQGQERVMHPYISEQLMAARQRDFERAYRVDHPTEPVRRHRRRLARRH